MFRWVMLSWVTLDPVGRRKGLGCSVIDARANSSLRPATTDEATNSIAVEHVVDG